jgi:Lon protease-like protein
MIYLLAQFPLQVVVFPGESIPLHIFEPRYRELIADCENAGLSFGITPMIEGNLMDTGTSMTLVSVKKRYRDGRLDVIVHATHTYRIQQYHVSSESRTYGSAEVIDLHLEGQEDLALELRIQTLMEDLYTIMRIPKKTMPGKFEIHQLVRKIALSLQEEYALLKMTNVNQRQQFMLERLEILIPKIREIEEIRRRIEMNGHNTLIVPPN